MPPPPGKIPTLVSGNPMAATSGAAMRRSQARLISNPPPMQRPLIAATTGLSIAAIASVMSRKPGSAATRGVGGPARAAAMASPITASSSTS